MSLANNQCGISLFCPNQFDKVQSQTTLGTNDRFLIESAANGGAKRYITFSQISGSGTGGGTWGSITGILSAQTDLQTALNNKVDKINITAGTNIGSASKTNIISYNAQGQITSVTATNISLPASQVTGLTAASVGLGNLTNSAQLTRSANDFKNSIPLKTNPIGADVCLLEDSASSGAKKCFTINTIPFDGGIF